MLCNSKQFAGLNLQTSQYQVNTKFKQMKLSSAVKGYGLVGVSVLAMSNVYIFSKYALERVHLSQFGVWWFAFGVIIISLFRFKTLNFGKLEKKCYKTLVTVGLFEVVSTSLFFLSIQTLSNPALVSFLGNTTPVFVTVLGIWILKERFSSLEFVGILITLFGSFLIGYNPGKEIPTAFYSGMVMIISSSLISAFSTVLVKRKIMKINPSILTLNRSLYLLVASVIYLIISHQSLIVPLDGLISLGLGAFLGPFLATVASYSALQYIEASRSAVLGSTKGVFVLITGWLYFSRLPSELQIIGGVFTIGGVLIISLARMFRLKKARQISTIVQKSPH